MNPHFLSKVKLGEEYKSMCVCTSLVHKTVQSSYPRSPAICLPLTELVLPPLLGLLVVRHVLPPHDPVRFSRVVSIVAWSTSYHFLSVTLQLSSWTFISLLPPNSNLVGSLPFLHSKLPHLSSQCLCFAATTIALLQTPLHRELTQVMPQHFR